MKKKISRACLFCIAMFCMIIIWRSSPPETINDKQAARAWYALGISFADEGFFKSARTMFEEVRNMTEPHSRQWVQATICLAMMCERMGSLDEADYYFVNKDVKHSNLANEARTRFPGAWRNARMILESQETVKKEGME